MTFSIRYLTHDKPLATVEADSLDCTGDGLGILAWFKDKQGSIVSLAALQPGMIVERTDRK